MSGQDRAWCRHCQSRRRSVPQLPRKRGRYSRSSQRKMPLLLRCDAVTFLLLGLRRVCFPFRIFAGCLFGGTIVVVRGGRVTGAPRRAFAAGTAVGLGALCAVSVAAAPSAQAVSSGVVAVDRGVGGAVGRNAEHHRWSGVRHQPGGLADHRRRELRQRREPEVDHRPHAQPGARLRRDDGDRVDRIRAERRRHRSSGHARVGGQHGVHRRRVQQRQRRQVQGHRAAQHHHRARRGRLQGADAQRHRLLHGAGRKPPLPRRIVHQGERCGPCRATRDQRDDRRSRPLHVDSDCRSPQLQGHGRRQRRGRTPSDRDQPGRYARHGHRQLHDGRRTASRPDRDARPRRHPGPGRPELVHGTVHSRVFLRRFRHLCDRCPVLAGRFVLRRHRDRWQRNEQGRLTIAV